MAIILSIETATEVCSVAISEDNRIIRERTLEDGMRHSAALTTLIKEVVQESGYNMRALTCVALSDGPGSYTGLRVGASTAKGICYALDIPLIAVSTLQSLAYDLVGEESHIMATIDARRMEAYAAIYVKGGVIKEVHSFIFSKETATELARHYDSLIITGTGIAKAADLFEEFDHIRVLPNMCAASLIAPLASHKERKGEYVNLAYHSPFYFKSPNITSSGKNILE